MSFEYIYKIESLETDRVCVVFEKTGTKEYISYDNIRLEDGSLASYYTIDNKDLISVYYENNQLARIIAKKVRKSQNISAVPTISISSIQDISSSSLFDESTKKSLSSVFGSLRDIKPQDKSLNYSILISLIDHSIISQKLEIFQKLFDLNDKYYYYQHSDKNSIKSLKVLKDIKSILESSDENIRKLGSFNQILLSNREDFGLILNYSVGIAARICYFDQIYTNSRNTRELNKIIEFESTGVFEINDFTYLLNYLGIELRIIDAYDMNINTIGDKNTMIINLFKKDQNEYYPLYTQEENYFFTCASSEIQEAVKFFYSMKKEKFEAEILFKEKNDEEIFKLEQKFLVLDKAYKKLLSESEFCDLSFETVNKDLLAENPELMCCICLNVKKVVRLSCKHTYCLGCMATAQNSFVVCEKCYFYAKDDELIEV